MVAICDCPGVEWKGARSEGRDPNARRNAKKREK